MGAVGTHAVPEHFAQDRRTAGAGVLEFFEDDHTGPFGDDESIPIAVEGPAGLGRRVVAGREGMHAGEAGDSHGGDGCFAATGHHDVGHVILDQPVGITDGIGGRGACGGDSGVWSAKLPVDGDISGTGVDHHFGDEKRGDTDRTAIVQRGMLHFDLVQSTHAAPDEDAVPVRIALGEIHPGLTDSLIGGCEGELGEAVEPLDLLLLQVEVVGEVEVGNFPAEPDLEVGNVEPTDCPYAAFAGADLIPQFADFAAERCSHPQSG